LVDLTSN